MIYSIGHDGNDIAVFGVITAKMPYYHSYTLITMNKNILYRTYGPAMLYTYTINMENLISFYIPCIYIAVLILGLHPANEWRRYFVTTSLIGCVQA